LLVEIDRRLTNRDILGSQRQKVQFSFTAVKHKAVNGRDQFFAE
jgi:hypothetical protein